MEKIPTAEEFLNQRVYITNDGVEDVHDSVSSVTDAMIDFAKLHVEAALEAAANEYYPKDKENFELVAKRFINAYSLDKIK